MHSSRGQATTEYVAAILLVAVCLISAAVVVAAPGVPATVVTKLRLGLCIVAGDVCTASDAAARGLEPCVVGSEEHATGTGVTLWILRAGGRDVWSARRLSNGTVVLTDGYGQALGVTAGIGVGKHQVGKAGIGIGFGSGRSWTLSGARFRQLLTLTRGDPHAFRLLLVGLLGEPDEVFREGSGDFDVQLEKGLSIGGAGAGAVLGRRSGRDGTTYYVDLGARGSGAIADVLPDLGLPAHLIGEYRTSNPPVLTVRGTTPRRSGQETETVLRLPLRSAADRALAQRVAFTNLGDPDLAMRDLAARVRDRGTVERARYRVREVTDAWDHGVELGVSAGIEHGVSLLERTLIDAQVLNGGPLGARREDCLSLHV